MILLQEALQKATEDLQETQRILGEAKERLREVEEGIASLQAKYEECVSKKEELENKTELCSARLTRAEKVQNLETIYDNCNFDPSGENCFLEKIILFSGQKRLYLTYNFKFCRIRSKSSIK